MASLSIDQIINRSKSAWETKSQWDNISQDAYALAFPSRNRYEGSITPGHDYDSEVFDSTLQSSNINLANKLHAELFPATEEFMKLVPGVAFDSRLSEEQREGVQAQLDQINAVHQAAMEVSNFDQAVNEMLLDYGVGTGVMMVREGGGASPLQYLAVNPAQMALGEGANGEVWEYYRKHRILPRLVRPTWKSEGFDPPEWWDAWAGDEENNKSKIVIQEVVYFSPEEDDWYLCILSEDHDNEGESGFVKLVDKKMRGPIWLSPRWNKEAGEVWGRGPVMYALPDAKVLNKTKELILKNASLTIFPPMTYVDDGEFNPALFSPTPMYMNPVSRNGGPLGKSVEKLDVGGDLGMAQLVVEDLQANIKRLMLDDQLPPQTGAVHSPTEIIARQAELQRSKAAPFGRLSKEFIRPLAQMNLNILAKKGLITPVKIDGLIIDLQILNPQAQAQQEEKVLLLQRVVEVAQSIDPNLPKVTMKVENIPQWTAAKLGVAPELMLSSQEREQALEMAGQIQNQQAEQGATDAQAV